MRCSSRFTRPLALFLGALPLTVGIVQVSYAQQPIIVTAATEKELNQSPLPPPQTTVQRTKLLTLQDAIVLALRNNPAIQSSRFQRISDRYSLELADYAFQPHFNLTGSTTFTESQPTGYNVNPGVTLGTRWGTQLSLSNTTNLQGNQQEQATIMQPLLRGFGAVNNFPWLNAQDNELIARQTFKSSIMTMVTQVINNYRQVVEDENNLTVRKKVLTLDEETARQYELRVKSGKMAPSELLQEQVTLAGTRLGAVGQANTLEQDYQVLLDTLGLSPESHLKVDTDIKFKIYKTPSKAQAIAIVLSNNPQYVSQKLQLNAARRAVESAKDNLRWQLNVTGSANFAGSSGAIPVITNVSSLSTTSAPTAALELAIPIRDISSKAALVDAKIGLLQAEDALEQSRRSLIQQVVNALRNLQSQFDQLTIAEQQLVLQRKNLEAARIKQQYGQIIALDVSTIQNSLQQQEVDFISSQIGYLNAVTEFENLLGTTLDEWHVEMRY